MATLENPFEKVRHKMVAARLEVLSQLAKFSQRELELAPESGEWSALVQAHHLYLAEGLMFEQIRRVQEEENPLLPEFSEVAPHLTRESETPVSLDAVLGGMVARREELFEYLSTLPVDAWELPFRHPSWGQRQFYQLVNVLPEHERAHAQQLAALKARL